MQRIVGFEPIVHGNDRILILGSMPSVISLDESMYYANKSNRFWQMLGSIYNLPFESIQDKYRILEYAKIALWDSCHSCIRKGSMDSNIMDTLPNDIPKLLEKNPSIQKIVCNGKTSYNILKKYYADLSVEIEVCPSTSAANARYKLEDLISIYKEAGI